MAEQAQVTDMLRRQVLGRLHVGSIRAGDRLPSIRQVAAESGVDHRAVAAAYRALADDGLVEIRPGSGVYVATVAPVGDVLPETARWLTDVLSEAWARLIPRDALLPLVARCTDTELVCACIESNEDHMVALAAALEEDFALRTRPAYVAADAVPGGEIPEAVRDADLVVTTAFHADFGRWAAEQAGVPLVVAAVDRDFVAALSRRLEAGGVTAVFVDRAFEARARSFLPPEQPRSRFVPLDQLANAIPPVRMDAPDVLATRAARRAHGMDDHHLLPPPARFIGAETARELHRVIVRLSLERGRADGG